MAELLSTTAVQPSHKKLTIGDEALDFALPDQLDRPIYWADLREKGAIVLFFYPKDNSVGCTAEVCAIRDNYEVFKDAGATVTGISEDSIIQSLQRETDDSERRG